MTRTQIIPRLGALILGLALAGCDVPTEVRPAPGPAPVQTSAPPTRLDADTAVRNFVTVVSDMEPVAERECRRRAPGQNCDFQIVVDDRRGQPPNAFQTLDRNGRPIVAFTLALIAEARNRDEIAFIMGHETAHHIAGHIPRAQQSAAAGAIVGGLAAAVLGTDVQTAQNLGASVGARRFSKDFELEADALGTIITARAGYDPVRGAAYFQRIPDPGNRFLGTHPPNADRIDIVRRTAAGL